MNLSIKPVTANLLEDYLWFFDNRAFCDNPEWQACYCMFYNLPATKDGWLKRTVEQNRGEAEQQIKDGSLQGFLAYDNGKPIAFCNANAKRNLWFDKYRTEINNSGTNGIAAVVCFVVDHQYRRKGISRALLQEAIANFKQQEYKIIEAYPSINTDKETHNYHGFYQLFKSEGFDEQSSYKDYCILSLKL